jgi:hypothetical protein
MVNSRAMPGLGGTGATGPAPAHRAAGPLS